MTANAVEAVGTDDLPPAGDEQREVLKRRQDRLDEQRDAVDAEGGRISPKAFRVESELAQHFNLLDVSSADPAYVYCWVCSSQHGLFIKMKLAQRWEVVQGDMPEAVELKGVGADTTRRLGDVILMRIRRDLHVKLKRSESAARQAQQDGIVGKLSEMDEQLQRDNRTRGAHVHVDESTMDPRTAKLMMDRAAAQSQATRFMDKQLRAGTMPGNHAPGTRSA